MKVAIERDAFESWAQNLCLDKREDGNYLKEGTRWAFDAWQERGTELEAELAVARLAVVAMAEDGWLLHGVEGMSEAQEKCYAAYRLISPPPVAVVRAKGKV